MWSLSSVTKTVDFFFYHQGKRTFCLHSEFQLLADVQTNLTFLPRKMGKYAFKPTLMLNEDDKGI